MTPKPYKALIFDWDGTLADSTAQIVQSMQHAAQAAGFPAPSDHDVRQVIGLSLDKALSTVAPNISADQREQLVYHYRRHYLSPANRTVLFVEAAQWLPVFKQHYWLTVATGKSRAGLVKSLADTASAGYFMATRTVDECASKPHPEMILSLCDELGLQPHEVLMIGDTTHDLMLAANAGADAVAVNTGAHDAATLQQAPHLALLGGMADLAHWLGLSGSLNQPNTTNI